jgi:cytidine deaminase
MKEEQFNFQYEVYDDAAELSGPDASLLQQARSVTKNAYAPYSKFFVGAAARLEDGSIITGTNQENASYPVGVCAERVLLGNAATLHPGIAVDTLAISYESPEVKSDHPISPCGMCRQSLLEYETRTKKTIRLLLAGQQGKVYVIKSVRSLLPLGFTSDELI